MTRSRPERLTLTAPDDWHLHLRDGAALADTVAHTARQFRRAIAMPNLKPPVVNTAMAAEYRGRILENVPVGRSFTPLMTLYLTDNTTPAEIERAAESGFVVACKLYPAGATTNSDAGVTDLRGLDPVLEAMAAAGMPLLIHGEVAADHVDIFEREKAFVDAILVDLVERHSGLKIVLEHITTAHAARFVAEGSDNLAATITAHHLLNNRNAMLAGGIRPHLYCLPILKREEDRIALLAAATSDNPRFFLGTDSAPHAIAAKESACGCAGSFTAHAALELYAEAFDAIGRLDRLEAFASHNGPDFYGLPRNPGTVTLVRKQQAVPATLSFGETVVAPFRAGKTVAWQLVDEAK